MKSFKSIAIICARGGSKGLKKKNLRLLDGEPLVCRAIRHAIESNAVDDVLVTTDDADIAEASIKAGAKVPFMRPAHLSGDLATTEETLRHALITYESMIGYEFDICVFLTPTDIFRHPSWISSVVYKLQINPSIESVFVGYETHKNFWEKNSDGSWSRLRNWMANYESRQIRRSIIREDTGLACASRAWLWRNGRRIGDKVDVLVIQDAFSCIDIHNLDDLKLAQEAIKIRDAK